MKQRLQCEVKSMCGGVEAREAHKIWKIYFPPQRQLSRCCWKTVVRWIGSPEAGGLNNLATAHQAAGRSSALSKPEGGPNTPRRGLGMAQRFMEKEGRPGEKNRISRWFDVPEGYFVTTPPPAEHSWIHDRWPLFTALTAE